MPHFTEFGLQSPKNNFLAKMVVRKVRCDICGRTYSEWKDAERCESSHSIEDMFKNKEVKPYVVRHKTQKDR